MAIVDDKTVYFVLGDMDTPELPQAPQSADANTSLLKAYVSLFKDFLEDSAKTMTDEAISQLTEEQLKELAVDIGDRMAAEPEMAAQYARMNDYERIALKWKEFAIVSSSPSAAEVATYCDAIVVNKQQALALLQQAEVDSSAAFRAAKILGAGAGRIMMALDVAGAIQDGATDPDAMFSGLAGIALGTVAGGLLLSALGGVAGLLALPAGAAVLAGLTVLAAGYAAAKIGEFIWDEFISGTFWETLDGMGIKEDVERFISMAGTAIDAVVPGAPESPPYKVVNEFDGEVIASNEKENVVIGNDGSNEVAMLYGRTVAFGKGGDDTYRVHTTARGNQVISDSDGENRLIFGIEDVGSLGITKVGTNLYKSQGGNFSITRVGSGEDTSLIVTSKHYDATVTILDWNNGDFGIDLPGLGETGPGAPAPAGEVLTNDDDLSGIDGHPEEVPNGDDVKYGLIGNDGIDGGYGNDYVDGGAGSDVLMGGVGNDTIAAGDGDDFIFDGSLVMNWATFAQAGWNRDTVYDYLAGAPAVVSYGDGWWLEMANGVAPTGDLTDYLYHLNMQAMTQGQPSPVPWTGATVESSGAFVYLDPNAGYMSGDDVIDAGAGADVVMSGEGNDTIDGGIGSDLIIGAEDNDIIAGGDGDDLILGDVLTTGAPVLRSSNWVSSSTANVAGNDVIDGGAGNDRIFGQGGSDVITGGEGNDTLWGDRMGTPEGSALYSPGAAGDDHIDGGAGDDDIYGNAGNDTLLGGSGVDTINGDDAQTAPGQHGDDHIDGGADNDKIWGWGGNDTLLGGSGDDEITGDSLTLAAEFHGRDLISGGDGNDTAWGFGGDDILFGDEGNDTLIGDADDSQLAIADHGNDQLHGGAGVDKLYGNGGNDTLDGGDDNDQAWGGAGDDIVRGGNGDDYLDGDGLSVAPELHGRDVLDGGAGADTLFGLGNDDKLFGGEGNDIMYGDDDAGAFTGNDTLSGGSGNDALWGGNGNDVLRGDEGNDNLEGQAGNDVLVGGIGDDVLNGGAGDDALSGGEGSDVLSGGSGNDHLQGGAGTDWYYFESGFGDDVVAGMHLESEGIDIVEFGSDIDPDSLVLTRTESGDLVITFTDSADRLTLEGYLHADSGGHEIRFANGAVWEKIDVIAGLAVAVSPGDGIDLTGTAGADTIGGTAGWDQLHGAGGDDIIYGHGGNDYIHGDEGGGIWDVSGNDVLVGGAGDDRLEGGRGNDALFGGIGDDSLHGEKGNDTLDGGDGNDGLSGDSGEDRLRGKGGADHLHGGTGNDFLDGGTGNDTLVGAAGADTYYFEIGSGHDVIHGGTWRALNEQTDIIRFGPGISKDDVLFSEEGDDLRITVNEDSVLITGFNTVGLSVRRIVFDDGDTHEFMHNTYMRGTNTADNIVLGDGNDQVYALDGDDIVMGGAGKDELQGGYGADVLHGGDGNDILYADGIEGIYDANDETSYDRIYGEAGDDEIYGGWGGGLLDGGDGDDYLHSHAGDFILIGGEGNDLIYAGSGSGTYTITGGAGNDIYSLRGNSTLFFGSDFGSDVIAEANGLDSIVLNFDHLNDLNELYMTVDFSDVGEGHEVVHSLNIVNSTDSIKFNRIFSGSFTVELSSGVTAAIPGYYSAVSQFEELDFHSNGHRLYYGLSGNDVFTGGEGNEIFWGGAGDDNLTGGAGDDKYIFDAIGGHDVISNAGGGTDTIYIRGALLIDRVTFEREGNDLLVLVDDGVETSVRVSGHFNGDPLAIDYVKFDDSVTLSGAHINYIIESGGSASDFDLVVEGTSSADQLVGEDGDDLLKGLAGNDQLFGMAGADTLQGGDGDDYLAGGNGSGTDSGADRLEGGAGNDTLAGEDGNDILIGGAGDDSYVYGGGQDIIDNTDGGYDGLFFNDGIDASRLGFSRDGDDLLITVDADPTPVVRVTNHFLGGDAAIDYVQPDGGSMLDTAAINALVDGGGDPGGGTGDDYDQVIEGSAAGEQLVGSGGKDLIQGLAGNDQLFGMSGDDTLQGGDGDDYLAGGNGGGSGSGADRLEGGAGNDTLAGEDGNDILIGGVGDDSYVYGGGQDTLDNTGGGFDGVFFNDGIDASRLGFSRDGDDLLITVDADPASTVRVSNHFLGGDAAIDYVQPDGGSMLDTAAINALADGGDSGGGGDPGGDIPGDDGDYPNVVEGTSAGEQLLGSNGRDLIRGLGGDDTMFAFGGDDKLEGGDGNDDLYGGNGSFSGSGNDILIGGAGADSLKGEDGDDFLMGGTGDDSYYYAAGSGSDTIDNTGGGSDYIYFASIARERLSFHRDGDDLIVRVDGDAGQQSRVLNHFQGGEYAIAFVQPGDGGYAIPASQFDGLLTPMAAGATTTTAGMSTGGNQQAMTDTNGTRVMSTGGNQQAMTDARRVSMSGNTPAMEVTTGTELVSTGGRMQVMDAFMAGNGLDYLTYDEGSLSAVDRLRQVTNWDFERRAGALDLGTFDPADFSSSQPGDWEVQQHHPSLRIEAPRSDIPDNLAETHRELDLLVNAMGGFPPGAVTTAEPDQGKGDMPGRELGWGAYRRNFEVRGSEHCAIMAP